MYAILSDSLTAEGCSNKFVYVCVRTHARACVGVCLWATGRASTELLWTSTLLCQHSSGDCSSPPSQIKTSVSVSWASEGAFSLPGAHLLEGETNGLFLLLFLLLLSLNKKKNDNHPAVCMTQKHQLKTILCITYYFMLGWNLSACINSLYKLRLVGLGRPLCWVGGGVNVVVFLDRLLLAARAGEFQFPHQRAHHERWRRRSNTASSVFCRVFGGGVGGRGLKSLLNI